MTTKADYVLIRGRIYSLDKFDRKYTSMAIKGNKIIYLGNDEGAYKYIGKCTNVINLRGKMVLPSFGDSHMHPPGPMLIDEIGVNLSAGNSLGDYKKIIEDYANSHPDEERIYGYGWDFTAFTGKEEVNGPRKEILDELNIAKPIILYSHDGHTVWLNSLAFDEFDINENTTFIGEKEPCEYIIKNTKEDEKKYGALWGTLKEDAFLFIEKKQLPFKDLIEIFEKFQKHMHKLGVTSVTNIDIEYMPILSLDFEFYKKLIENKKLKLRVSYSQCINPHYKKDDNTVNSIEDQVDELISKRAEIEIWNNPYFKVVGGKFFMDGVIETRTAYMNTPYIKMDYDENCTNGYNMWEDNEDKLEEAVRLLNQNGFQAHFHAIGDEAATLALDTIEKVNKEGNSYRNLIIHLQFLKRRDIERMRRYNVIASLQVYWHFKTLRWEPLLYGRIGELAEYEYPLNSLIKKGVLVAGASDYPVSEPNALIAIQAGVTRNYCYDEGEWKITSIDDPLCLLNEYERASLNDMIEAYTKNAAYANFMDDKIGTLEVNKCADFVVLDKDLYCVDPLNLHKVKVLMTFFDGQPMDLE